MFGQSNNTSSQGLFGNKPPSGGLFGGGAGTGGASAGTNAGANAGAGGGLFGNQSLNQSGLFGNKPASGGMFGGGNNATANNTGGSGGLFGNNSSNTNTNTSGGLFGNNNNTNSNTSGGLFGNNNNNTNTNTSGGLFGNNNNTNSNTSGGLFGNNTNSNTSGGLFGNNNTNSNTNSNTSGGLFNNASNPPQFNQNQLQMNSMTRVGDLPEPIKRELQQFDKYINQQHLIATNLQSTMKKHDELIKSLPKDINYLYIKLKSTKQALKFDSNHLQELKSLNNELTDDINRMLQLILQLSVPGTKLSSSSQLNDFFIKKIKQYHQTISNYDDVVKEFTEILHNLEQSLAQGVGNFLTIFDTIKSQFNLFMELCDKLAQLHSELGKWK